MRVLEVRRHSMRNKPNEHISLEGIELAQLIGLETGPFDLVVTSPIPRAVETSVAMGFAINETLPVLADLPSEIFHSSGWPAQFEQLQKNANQHDNVGSFAKTQANAWRDIVCKVEDSERALVVTHGLFLELGIIACFPETKYFDCDPIGYCEGVRIMFEDEKFQDFEILRVPPDRYSVNN